MTAGAHALVLRGATGWKTNEMSGSVSGATTLTVDDSGLHFRVPALTLKVLATEAYRSTLVDGTISYPWAHVTGAERGPLSVVIRVNRFESLRFHPGPSRVKVLVAALEQRGVPVNRTWTTFAWGFTG